MNELASASEAAAALVDAVIAVPCIEPNWLVEHCVAACRTKCPGAEIVVVADKAPDDAKLAGAELLVTGFLTMAAKRNLVATRSKRTYLGLIDSDAYPQDGWMQNAIALLCARPDIFMVGGPNISFPDDHSTGRYAGAAQRSFLVTGSYAFRKRKDAAARYVADLPSCNMVLRRADYVAIGGMREDLYMYEDKELCARILNSEKRIYFSPGVTVFHKDRPLHLFVNQRLGWGASLWKGMRRFGIQPYLLLPTIAISFFLSAPLALVWPAWAWLYLGVVALYFGVTIVEGVRRASAASDIPGVWLAIVIGNLAPGAGSLLGPLGLLPDLRKIYRNLDSSEMPKANPVSGSNVPLCDDRDSGRSGAGAAPAIR